MKHLISFDQLQAARDAALTARQQYEAACAQLEAVNQSLIRTRAEPPVSAEDIEALKEIIADVGAVRRAAKRLIKAPRNNPAKRAQLVAEYQGVATPWQVLMMADCLESILKEAVRT